MVDDLALSAHFHHCLVSSITLCKQICEQALWPSRKIPLQQGLFSEDICFFVLPVFAFDALAPRCQIQWH
jgi:hypothetical protein